MLHESWLCNFALSSGNFMNNSPFAHIVPPFPQTFDRRTLTALRRDATRKRNNRLNSVGVRDAASRRPSQNSLYTR